MKRFLIAVAIAATSFAAPVLATDVGVSVSIGQPGFYGRLDIGDYPQPQVIYREPVVVQRVAVTRPPIYLRVPPGHAKHWSSHCREYNACGERVMFVQDNWYNRVYVPQYREHHGDHRDNNHGNQGNHGNDHRGNDHGRGH